jgi:ABC-type thiamin/hydroxymethylpyrimidine transport system permease subunit
MKTLLDLVLVLAWLSVYLGVVYVAGQYRRTRARALGVVGRDEFRAENDLGVWCVTLVTGVMLGAAAFFAAKVFGALP